MASKAAPSPAWRLSSRPGVHLAARRPHERACDLQHRDGGRRAPPPVVAHVVHSLDGGGTERTLLALLRAFDPEWMRHAVITMRAAGPLAARLPDHTACRALGIRGRSRNAWLTLARAFREIRADVIHARNTGCWADALLAHGLMMRRARLVLGFHGLEQGGPFTQGQRWLARCALRAGARFTSVSESGARQLTDQARVPLNRLAVLSNGVDLQRFRPMGQAARRSGRYQLGLDDSDFVVGVVGSLTPVKCHKVLIDAIAALAASVPGAHLLIVGDGPLRMELERHARDAGIANRVHFTGWRDDIPELLACMDVYVCSSASEGMSNALLEAMGVGLPVVATEVGDNAVVARDGKEGCIVEPGSATPIVEALLSLASRPAMRQQLGAMAHIRAAGYGLDQTVHAYQSYYASLLTARRPRRADCEVPGREECPLSSDSGSPNQPALA